MQKELSVKDAIRKKAGWSGLLLKNENFSIVVHVRISLATTTHMRGNICTSANRWMYLKATSSSSEHNLTKKNWQGDFCCLIEGEMHMHMEKQEKESA